MAFFESCQSVVLYGTHSFTAVYIKSITGLYHEILQNNSQSRALLFINPF